MGCIYRWRNKINGKGYTGKTEQGITTRDKQRFQPSRKNENKPLKDAMKKYGKENFTREIIEDGITDPEYLKEREMYWIAHFGDFHNGYNQTEGGDGWTSETVSGEKHPMYGKNRPKTTCQKISKALSGRTRPVDVCQKISERKKGKNYGMIGEKASMYGKNHSTKTRQRMSQAKKGKNNPNYGNTGEKNPNLRPEYTPAKWFFFLLLPVDMDIKEKRKHLYEKFRHVPQRTLYRWVGKWQSDFESES